MELLQAINQIKPKAGVNSFEIKSIIEVLQKKMETSIERDKTYTVLDNALLLSHIGKLETFRVDMILGIMQLQKSLKHDPSMLTEDECDSSQSSNIIDLTIRVAWLERYCEKLLKRKLSYKYYSTKSKDLPK